MERKEIIGVDFKDYLFDSTLYINNIDTNLKKWIRYDAVEYGDADVFIRDNIDKIYSILEWDKCGYSKKWIDCIYSFRTYWNAFLRLFLPKYSNKKYPKGYIMDNYNYLFNYYNKKAFADKINIEYSKIEELFDQLNKFAKNTHTIGNYMPCPTGKYNKIKGSNFQDRIDLLYKKLSSREGEIRDWIEKNKDKLYLNEMLLGHDYECSMQKARCEYCKMKSKEDVLGYISYLNKINNLIEKRNRILEHKIIEI